MAEERLEETGIILPPAFFPAMGVLLPAAGICLLIWNDLLVNLLAVMTGIVAILLGLGFLAAGHLMGRTGVPCSPPHRRIHLHPSGGLALLRRDIVFDLLIYAGALAQSSEGSSSSSSGASSPPRALEEAVPLGGWRPPRSRDRPRPLPGPCHPVPPCRRWFHHRRCRGGSPPPLPPPGAGDHAQAVRGAHLRATTEGADRGMHGTISQFSPDPGSWAILRKDR
jgi:hypothetical protein